METELNPIEQLWMSEQAAVVNVFGQLGEIFVVAGIAVGVILLIGAIFLGQSEDQTPGRGLSLKLKSLFVVYRQRPRLMPGVLKALALIACLVAAAQA
jgi:hypothetical protein